MLLAATFLASPVASKQQNTENSSDPRMKNDLNTLFRSPVWILELFNVIAYLFVETD